MMKNIILILLSFSFFSCDDWLNVESEKSVTFINYFKSENQLEALFNTILSNEHGICATQYRTPHEYAGMYVDDVPYETQGFRELDAQSYLNTFYIKDWATFYDIIGLANTIIDNRHRFENISDERAEFWLDQAYFIKSVCYFYLAQMFGEAPIVATSETITPQARRPVEEVLEEAVRCAKEALSLPTHDQIKDSNAKLITSKQYASLGSVHTLLANIYAWMGGILSDTEYWELAERHASEVIDKMSHIYRLENNIIDVIHNTLGEKRLSAETIFSIEINDLDQDFFHQAWFSKYYLGQELIDWPYLTTDTAALDNAYSKTRISVESVKKLYNEEQDQRRKEYWYNLGGVKYYGINWDTYEYELVYAKYAHFNKWRTVRFSSNPEFTENPQIGMEGDKVIWRLADLILLRAECRTRLNKPTAIDDLNVIRNRAGLNNYTGSLNSDDLRKEIFNERTRELYGETIRYYDIVRNGYYRELLYGKFQTLTDEDVMNGALYLPINNGAFIDNSLMKQNKYWLWQQ